MSVALLGLGSNVGERRAHLQAALDALPAAGVEVLRSSSVYDTDPVGEVLEQASFLNACALARTALEPLELLDAAKRLERELGRDAHGVRHGPRAIDIDILTLGDVELCNERMKLPHEQLLRRRFVLIPALELDLELRTPDGSMLADALLGAPAGGGRALGGRPLAVPDDRASAVRERPAGAALFTIAAAPTLIPQTSGRRYAELQVEGGFETSASDRRQPAETSTSSGVPGRSLGVRARRRGSDTRVARQCASTNPCDRLRRCAAVPTESLPAVALHDSSSLHGPLAEVMVPPDRRVVYSTNV